MKPFKFHHVLAPTDLTDASAPALRYARLFADRFGAKLTVLHTDPIMYMGEFAGPTAGYAYPLTTPAHQERLRVDVENQVAAATNGRPCDVDVTVGQPVPVILSAAKDLNADLIVMGTHRRHGWRRALIGSVTDGVLHGSTCPVLTIAGREIQSVAGSQKITNILCPINFTPVAREALDLAGSLAEAFNARLTIVHVVEADEATNAKSDEQWVRRWVSPSLQDACSYREIVLRGGAAERVLDCADDLGADFLVIGAQHKLFRDATVIGSTTERLIRFASCPVLIAPRAPEVIGVNVEADADAILETV